MNFVSIALPGRAAHPVRRRARAGIASFALVGALTLCASAYAEEPATPAVGAAVGAVAPQNPAVADAPAGAPANAPANAATPAPTSLWERSTLLGEMGGLRPWLGNYGVSFGLQETSEYLSTLSGGINRRGAYDGLTEMSVGLDTAKAFGLADGIFNASAFQIHGRNLSTTTLQTQQLASGIEADSGTRLWELWYQQSLWQGRADVKVGQQSLDQEFMTSQSAGNFMNATFGWPVLPSADLPSGGPAYPLSALGVRARVQASDTVSWLGGVFDGNPAGQTLNVGDPQKLDAHGTNFNLHNGAWFITELQYALNAPPADPKAAAPSGLPGTYKIGAWYNSQRFLDQQYASNGVPLASPASSGVARSYRGDYSFYAVADQMVWRASPDSPRSLGIFARLSWAPGDRNVIGLGLNAGVALKAPFAGRDNDVAGLALGYAKIGNGAIGNDSSTALYTTPNYPIRGAETLIEATYVYQIAPWWQVQGDLQYVLHPGGGVVNPNNPGQTVGNETVLGIRTTIAF
jgi:porin